MSFKPEHYQPIMPYLVLENADEFIDFIKAVFDAEEKLVVRFPDGSIMHSEFSLNGGTILLGQSSDAWPPFPAPMYLVTEKVDRLYAKGVENGATGNQEPGERGYGRSAGFIDRWGKSVVAELARTRLTSQPKRKIAIAENIQQWRSHF